MNLRRIERCLTPILLAWLCSCDADSQGKERAAENAARDKLAHDPELSDSLGQAIVETARRDAVGWLKDESVRRGTLNERERQQFLWVMKYGRCYRVLAEGDPAQVQDLDLALIDAHNVETQRDVSEGPHASLGVNASICPVEATAVRIEARMRRGHGNFALAVFRDE
jgi:hypothetical protein